MTNVERALRAERLAVQCFAIGDLEGQQRFDQIAERAWRKVREGKTALPPPLRDEK